MFRSQNMKCYNVLISRGAHWETVNALGRHPLIHFHDENGDLPGLQREFYNYIKRCEDIEIQLKYIKAQGKLHGLTSKRCNDPDDYLNHLDNMLAERQKAEHTYLEDVEEYVNSRKEALAEQTENYTQCQQSINKLYEENYCLKMANNLLNADERRELNSRSVEPDFGATQNMSAKKPVYEANRVKFSYFAGVINSEDVGRLKKIIFRTCRGNAITASMDIEVTKDVHGKPTLVDPLTGKQLYKSVFFVAYSRMAGQDLLKPKLTRIINSLEGTIYSIPEDNNELQKKLIQIDQEIIERMTVAEGTKKGIELLLQEFFSPNKYGYSSLDEYKMFAIKEKTIYAHLNMLKKQSENAYVGRLWMPQENEEDVKKIFIEVSNKNRTLAPPQLKSIEDPSVFGLKPPTYIRTNEVTMPFQEIVNTYGYPRYKEVNPGIFTVATFPYLFGVMFGDIGHGIILFLFSSYICLFKDCIQKQEGSLLKGFLPIRYLFLMMSMFAIYNGYLYNDCMSVPTALFDSCYSDNGQYYTDATKQGKEYVGEGHCTYPFGIDYVWASSELDITFLNSLKMKLAVIFGVTHMTFGILMKGVNEIYFRRPIEFIFEFIPQLVFFVALFGYMVILIFIKWATPFENTGYAPSIITLFINIMSNFTYSPDPPILSDGVAEYEYTGKGQPLYGNPTGSTEHEIESTLLYVALLMVPLMLFVKPVYKCVTMPKDAHHAKDKVEVKERSMIEKTQGETQFVKEGSEPLVDPDTSQEIELDKSNRASFSDEYFERKTHHEEEPIGEIFIHQMIETIEFVLGSISNTASYLRLWALSLAHSQLAAVFFQKSVGATMKIANPWVSGIFTIFSFQIFLYATALVLLMMDIMECFLHTLRLHWVEFQNKFYKADGYAFEPIHFKKSIEKIYSEEVDEQINCINNWKFA